MLLYVRYIGTKTNDLTNLPTKTKVLSSFTAMNFMNFQPGTIESPQS